GSAPLSDSAATLGNAAIHVPARQRTFSRGSGQSLTPYALVMPALTLMLLMLLGPLTAVIALSFTDYQLGAPSLSWVGLANYHEMFADKVFWTSLRNTLLYVGIVVPGAVTAGLAIALLIQSGTSLRSLYRTIYFLPVMATLIAMAVV